MVLGKCSVTEAIPSQCSQSSQYRGSIRRFSSPSLPSSLLDGWCHPLTVPPSGLCDVEAAPSLWAFLVGPWSHALLAGTVYQLHFKTHSLWLIYPNQTEMNGLASEDRTAHVPGTFGSLITPLQFGECVGVLGRGLLRPRKPRRKVIWYKLTS